MNTFIIKEDYGASTIFDRICHSPPSLEEKTLISNFLKKYKFSNLGYRLDIIDGNNHRKVTGLFHNIDKFFDYLEDLCKEGIGYGVVMYLNH